MISTLLRYTHICSFCAESQVSKVIHQQPTHLRAAAGKHLHSLGEESALLLHQEIQAPKQSPSMLGFVGLTKHPLMTFYQTVLLYLHFSLPHSKTQQPLPCEFKKKLRCNYTVSNVFQCNTQIVQWQFLSL